MVFFIFLRKGSVRHGIYFEGSAREKRLRNAALETLKIPQAAAKVVWYARGQSWKKFIAST